MEEIRWCHCGDEIEDPNATECEFCSSLKIELEENLQLYYKTKVNKMTKLEIIKSELEPQENEWYHVKITFNTNKIISFFFKESIEISQYDPNSKVVSFGWDTAGSPTTT